MTARIRIEGYHYDDETHNTLISELYDMHEPDDIRTVLIMFGNACWDEVKISGETAESISLFIALLNKGGYFFATNGTTQRNLYENGFGMLPENDPFIFINPVAENGQICEMKDIHLKKEIVSHKKQSSILKFWILIIISIIIWIV